MAKGQAQPTLGFSTKTGAAARPAAWDAAGAAAQEKLAATKSELQASAVLLVERMCALSETTEN